MAELKPLLDRAYTEFDRADRAQRAVAAPAGLADPIDIVRRFTASDDREVVGFVAAALAFGRVASVLQSIERVLGVMGPHPADYVRRFDPRRDTPAFRPIVHRWTRGNDIAALVWILHQVLRRSGSIESFFLEGFDAATPDLSAAIDSFSTRALAFDLAPVYGRVPKRPGVCYFFPRASTGSACKRLNLFLRWMVRRDSLDLGVWSHVPASKLIVPLDTHVIRLGRCLQLTKRTSPGWRMAADITAALRKLDAGDPVKYDFAICHIGMMNACGFNRAHDPKTGLGPPDRYCPLRGACRPRARTPRRSARPSVRR
jgi:uncharacterized protein (TIGR02757 family)